MTPETYSKIVAKRPELKVTFTDDRVQHSLIYAEYGWLLQRTYKLHANCKPLTEQEAHALIESHWLRKLEPGTEVHRNKFGFSIVSPYKERVGDFEMIGDSATITKEFLIDALTEHFSKEIACSCTRSSRWCGRMQESTNLDRMMSALERHRTLFTCRQITRLESGFGGMK